MSHNKPETLRIYLYIENMQHEGFNTKIKKYKEKGGILKTESVNNESYIYQKNLIYLQGAIHKLR